MIIRKVVVTGLGAISPLGLNVKENWENALKGISGIKNITYFDTSFFATKIAGQVPPQFDPLQSFNQKEIRRTDRFTQYAVVAAGEAVQDSGIDLQALAPSRAGVFIGTGMGGLTTLESVIHDLEERTGTMSPMTVPMVIPNMAAGWVSIKFGIKGPNLCTTTACAAGAHSIGNAYWMIQNNVCDVMVAGGAESPVNGLTLASFGASRALSTRNDEPEKASRPFDRDRDGFVLSEGAGILVLEEYEHAVKRGAQIYAELIGYGLSGDAFHPIVPSPDQDGIRRCMLMAIDDAGLIPSEIQYINAHGTGTKLNDVGESQAIEGIFGRDIAVSSTKSMTGHLIGGAGGLEAIFACLSIFYDMAPHGINLDNPDEGCNLDYIRNAPREFLIERAMSNSFGFGGTNATLIFGDHQRRR